MKLIFLLLTFFSSAFGQSIERTGKMFEIGKTDGTPLFIHHEIIKTNPANEKILTATIKDSTGATVMTEEARYSHLKMISHRIEQLQISEVYELKITDSKAIMQSSKISADGSLKAIDRKEIPDNQYFILGPVSIPFLQNNFDELINEKTVKANFGIYEIMKHIEFKFIKERIDEDFLTIRMKPSSLFFNLFVDPMDMKFDRRTKHLVWFKGRTAVRKTVNGKLKPFDSEILYETKINAKP